MMTPGGRLSVFQSEIKIFGDPLASVWWQLTLAFNHFPAHTPFDSVTRFDMGGKNIHSKISTHTFIKAQVNHTRCNQTVG